MEREARLNMIESFVQILKSIDEFQTKFILDKEHFFMSLKIGGLSEGNKKYAENMILENDEYSDKCNETKALIHQEMFKLID
jgi:hypothetical protein